MTYQPINISTDLDSRRFSSTDKALRYRGMALDAVECLKKDFIVGNSGHSYEPVLLRVSPGNIISVETQDALIKMLLNKFIAYETASTIKRELPDVVMGMLADHKLIQLTDIRPFMFKNEEAGGAYTWNRLAFDPDPEAPEVEEYESMRKRTNADAFRSQTEFFGSILDYSWLTEQYLHLSGRGNDGKSTLVAAIRAALPATFAVAIQSEDLRGAHGTAKLEGKRLLVFSEENSASFMSSGRFKQLTGRDPMPINPKNENEREIVPNCRIIVTSNQKPYLSGNSADMRRIIPVFYESFGDGIQGDQSWTVRMKQRGTDILKYCYAQFIRNVRGSGKQRLAPDAEFVDLVGEISTGRETEAAFATLFERTDRKEVFVTPQAAIQHVNSRVKDRIERTRLRQYIQELPQLREHLPDNKRGPRLLNGWAIKGDDTFK